MAILTREQVEEHRKNFYGRLFGTGNTTYMREIGIEGMDLADTALDAIEKCDKLRDDNKNLRELLRELEMNEDLACPICRQVFGNHEDDCRLAAALR